MLGKVCWNHYSVDYLTINILIMTTKKENDISLGEVVVVQEKNAKRNSWKTAIVENLFRVKMEWFVMRR